MRDLAVFVLLGLACAMASVGMSARLLAGDGATAPAVERCFERWDDEREPQPHLECRAPSVVEAAGPSPRRSQGRH